MAELDAPFVPRWLYHPERPAELVETQGAYDTLMAQGLWAESPAAFGQITAPNREQAILMGPVVAVGGETLPMTTTDALTLHLNSKVEAVAAQVAAAESEVEVLHGLLQALHAAHDTLAAQVQEVLKPKPAPASEKK